MACIRLNQTAHIVLVSAATALIITHTPVPCCRFAFTLLTCCCIHVTFINNRALIKDGAADSGAGGALFIQAGQTSYETDGVDLVVKGSLCAQDNKAEKAGGFVSVQADGQMLFASGSNANVTQKTSHPTLQ
jgi:hypothetical protein